MAKLKYEPDKEEQKQKLEKAIKSSVESVEQKIFSDDLNNKFKDLEIAIQAEEEKLKKLYGIEKELANLVVVINAGKDYMTELENNKNQKSEELNDNIKKLEEEYRIKKEELQKDYESQAKKLKLERDRECEEYEYNIKREREISNNKWKDEKNKRELELSKKEEEIEKLLNESEASANHLVELENKVNAFPELLEKEYSKGRKDATQDLEKENKYLTELLKKDFQNIIDIQNDKIESLKEEVEKYNSQNTSLQEKLEQAYIQIKEMATKTVEATGGVKILGNNANDIK